MDLEQILQPLGVWGKNAGNVWHGTSAQKSIGLYKDPKTTEVRLDLVWVILYKYVMQRGE